MTRPELRELECFVAVAEHLNFSRAARQMNLSQPPLTRHIQSLEAKAGCLLLTRNTHSVALTEQGRLFLEDAREILANLDRTMEMARRASHGETSRLRLAFVGALLDERLVRLVRRFRGQHPNCQIQIADLSPAAQLQALKEEQLDGGFIGAQPASSSKDLHFIPWSVEPLLLAVPADHPLASGKVRSWAQLRKLPWVMVSQGAAPAFRRQFAELARQHNLSERIVQESDRLPAVLTMVAVGSGVTMVPKSATHLLTEGVHFQELPAPRPCLKQTFACRSKQASPVLKDFLELLKKI
jgi:DNA-binding transcriptional LysR family regulator